ncbi:unnamed protein product [Cunninghamella blakesleeana]
MAQLEITNHAIINVETTTCQIENMLKDLGLSQQQQQQNEKTRDILVHAEQSLDSAIKSASHIYIQQKQLDRRPSSSVGSGKSDPPALSHRNSARLTTTRIKYRPDTKHLLRQLNDKLRELELDAGKFFESIGTTNDVNALQKAYVDLDLAKTIALSAKSNLKRRKILLTSSRRRNDTQVKELGEKIREGVEMWKTYTRNAPLIVNGEDILIVLDLQDNLLDRNLSLSSSRMSIDMKSRGNSPTNSSSSTTTTSQTSYRPSWRQSLSNRNRSGSISDNSAIPVPTTPTLVPLNSSNSNVTINAIQSSTTNVSNTNNKKPINRHSSATVSHRVKANIGVGTRVRTASLTNKNKENQKPSQTTNSMNNIGINNNNNSGSNTPPLLPSSSASQLPPLPTSSTNQNDKPSMIKPPSQRGPGSTLRIRSMLAKRSNQQGSIKSNIGNDN